MDKRVMEQKVMATREELREGINKHIKAYAELGSDVLTGMIMDFLHSKDVVLKVERELPSHLCECCFYEDKSAGEDFCFQEDCADNDYKQWKLKAGYCAVAPLISVGSACSECWEHGGLGGMYATQEECIKDGLHASCEIKE